MKAGKIILFVLLIAAAWLAGYGYGRWYGLRHDHSEHAPQKAAKGYHCPMHPTYRSDRPGSCPICGMDLVPDQQEEQPKPAHGKILYYRDPHDHNYRADTPGLNPETGNTLEPVYEGDASTMPMGTIRITPEKQQLIGVRYGVVEARGGTHSFRAVGKVSADETRIAKVQSRIEGWIDKVFVDFIGKEVRKGQPLLTIYSPEMLASQQEYLLAIKSRGILQNSPLRSSQGSGDSLVEAARRRLELYDLSEDQIREIESAGRPIQNITLHSPINGYVTMRQAFPKQRITPETELYTVVDLSRVWIMADVFENEIGMIREGMPVQVRLTHAGGRAIQGRVSYIQPQVDPATRTLKIRIEAANPSLALKPDMFVDVEFQAVMPARLSVPAEAVLDSGLKRTVFVDRGNGYLEPRRIETGERMDDRIEVLKGLKAGERIVVSGNFLIDSESQMKAAAAGMAGHQHD